MTAVTGLLFFWMLVFCLVPQVYPKRYDPNWKSLDSRPLPAWYDEGKIGIMIHWGVFSVPSFGNEWFGYRWLVSKRPLYVNFMKANYRPDFTYADFAPMFTAEFYNPNRWADIFQAAGAKYIVLTTKHHEGFTLWPSKYSFNWNAGDVGPKRDLVGDLADAIRSRTDIKFGVYHSMYEWFNPLFNQDKANGFKTQEFVKYKTMPELYELVNQYKPDVIWSDGSWDASYEYWNSTNFLAWLYNDSPVKDTVVVNDRWGAGLWCKHGGFWNCHDHFNPGKLVPHKWENCVNIDKCSWAWRRNAHLEDFRTMREMIVQVASTISFGGNLLIDIGPTAYGEIIPIFEERLRQLGSWLKVNGEAIYKSHVWAHQTDNTTENVWYTSGKTNSSEPAVYAIFLDWPENNLLKLDRPVATDKTQVSMLGYPGKFEYISVSGGGMVVTIPAIPASRMPCDWGWVLKLTGLKNQKTKLNPEAFAKSLQSIRRKPDPICP